MQPGLLPPLPSGEGRGEGDPCSILPPSERHPQTRDHRERKRDRDKKSRPHSSSHPQALDEQSAERRRYDDGKPFQDRLDREADDAARTFELLANESERGGQSERLPGHDQEDAEEHAGNRPPEKVDEESDRSQAAETNQGAAVAEPIREPTARISVRGIQKVLKRAEGADHESRGSQKTEVFRQIARPELLSEAEDEDPGCGWQQPAGESEATAPFGA